MKTMKSSENFVKQIFEYLTRIATHGGYHWDGIMIQPGTAVASFKSIAADTGLSYYRVKKCIATLAESGSVTITRYKCFAIITIKSSHEPIREVAPAAAAPAACPAVNSNDDTGIAMPPMPNRATRRRLAREAAREARRDARRRAHRGTPRTGARSG